MEGKVGLVGWEVGSTGVGSRGEFSMRGDGGVRGMGE